MMRYDYRELMRTGRIVPLRAEHKTPAQILEEVKRNLHRLIAANNVKDDELEEIIRQVKSGTRNLIYLAPGDNWQRLKDIAAYVVREHGWN